MYDKSKKTWSQRLKIHKNEKSQATTTNNIDNTTIAASGTTTGAAAGATSTTTTSPQNIEATLNVAHNVSIRSSMPQYQIAPTAIMHLPTLSDYHHPPHQHPQYVQLQNGGGGSGSHAGGYDFMSNHLGRSMKYAEPWLYGTVRGIPTRPALYHPAYGHAYATAHPHAAAIFATPNNELPAGTAAMAVVLCSCPEYLSGTKGRTLKKPSLCKKCKGTRLPLANFGGTVRLTSNIPSSKLRPVGASATVRVVSSTKKQRPTILDPQKDPYDLMRRTRLLSPEPGNGKPGPNLGSSSGSSSKDNSRHRGRSASPVRGRSRTRHHYKALATNSKKAESSAKALESLDDAWLTESEDLAQTATSSATTSRRSILRCNVNPYDLISINQQNSTTLSTASGNSKSPEALTNESSKKARKQKLQFSQNEFMPPNDDFNVQDAALTEDEPPFVAKSSTSKRKSGKQDSAKKEREDSLGTPTTPTLNKKPNYANVQAIAGQRISLGEEQQTTKSLLQQSADGTATYECFSIESDTQKSKDLEKSTKPRPDSLQVSSGEPKRPPRAIKTHNDMENKDHSIKEAQEDEEVMVTVTVTPTYNIKSILKRPTSKSSENGEQKQTDSPNKSSSSSVPSTPKTREGSTSSSKSGGSTPTNSRRNQMALSSPTANSQFYIPLPQARKKVQFLDEDQQQYLLDEQNEEEEDDDEDEQENDSLLSHSSSSSPSSMCGDIKTNYEYYNKKRNQPKLIHLNDAMEIQSHSEDTDGEIIYDEKFIQAMLLEKLQLDSEMVTQRYNINQNYESKSEKDADVKAKQFLENLTTPTKTDYDDVFPYHSNNVENKSQFSQHEQQQQQQHQSESKINKIPNDDKQKMSATTQSLPSSLTAATSNSVTPSSSSSTSSFNSATPTSSPTTTHHHVTDMSGKNDDDMFEECLPSKEKIFFTDSKECSGIGAGDDDGAPAVDENNDYNISNNNDDEGDIVSTESYADIDVNIGTGQHYYDHHHIDKNLNDDNVNVSLSTLSSSSSSKAQQNGATKSTTSDYDDDAKIKQQQKLHLQQQQQKEQEQQLRNSKKCKKDIQTLKATDRNSTGSSSSSRETQSRNPIRRSQSERQPTTYHNNNNSSSSNNGFNHKNRKNGSNNNGAGPDTNSTSSSSNSNANENVISNTRNGLKDIENIPNIKNGNFTASMESSGGTGGGNLGVDVIVNANKTLVNFQDTMALRNRYNRNDTRDLFTMSLIGRPREPPPPPPSSPSSSSSSTTSSSNTPSMSNSLLKAKDLKDTTKSITLATDAIESCQQHQEQEQQTVNGLENKQHEPQQTIGFEQKPPTTHTIFYKEINGATYNDGKEVVQQQQQMVVNTKSITTTQLTNGEQTSTTDISSLERNNYENKGTPTTSTTILTTPTIKPQRTVVRVAPFNKNSFEVHRLKISHTDNHIDDFLAHSPMAPNTPNTPNTPNSVCSNNSSITSSHYSVTDLSTLDSSHDYGQKKTSILINGDDCYSTTNLSCDDSSTPLYQSSVVVTDGSCHPLKEMEGLKVTNSNYNTVTINVSSPRSSEDELILQHNQLNNLLKRQSKSSLGSGSIRAIIPIRGTIDINLQRSASSTSSTSTSSLTSTCSSTSSSSNSPSKRGKTLIRLDYDKEKLNIQENRISSTLLNEKLTEEDDVDHSEWLPHETELLKILRNPVEAVKRNLVPHICKLRETDAQKDGKRSKKMNENHHSEFKETSSANSNRSPSANKSLDSSTFIGKLLEDPMLNQVAEGLETDTVAELIENSLKRLQESRCGVDMSGTKDNEDMNRLIDISLRKIKEERNSTPLKDSSSTNGHLLAVPLTKEEERLSNRGSISSANSFASAHNYELFDFEAAIEESDCYQSCSSEVNSLMEDDAPSPETKSKFYQMLVDATLQEIELSTNIEDTQPEEHEYESIRHNTDPIYEEISDMPPPLPLSAPPLNDPDLEKKSARSIFEGASKYDILSYLVDAKERGLVKEEPFDYPLNCSNPIIIEEESADTLSDLGKLSKLKRIDTISSRSSIMSDSSDDNQSSMSSLSPPSSNNFILLRNKHATSDIERNDSGVGSETSKSSRSKYLSVSSSPLSSSTQQPRSSPLHLCEDCDGTVETQLGENGHVFAPLVCRKCGKKRVERKEIITEIVETEEKYGRDLQIILEEFCHPMFVAGLLTQEQLSAIFLNTEELLENNQTLAERMRDALDIALEQGDDDLLTVNIGKIFLDSTQMLHAFESYCVRQAGASLLLANLEKERELLRIFLKVSQMENAVLRRMNLNSFLMVPVQRVTKYPLLLARLYKVTPAHLEGRDQLKQAQEKIELHLNHINQEAKDVPTKLWRRISSSSPNRRASCEIDMINIKLRKMAIDVLEWNHDEVRFVMEGKLLYTQPTDSNWKKARTIKLTTVNALLVTNGKPSTNYKAEKVMSDKLNFPKHTGIREASLLVVKEKCGRYTLIREPLYLDRCVVCSEADWDEYFEIQEISSKDTFIFKAEDNVRTKQWYTQLQYHAQGMGAWRKRRNALANIMINGMLTRS